MAHTLSNYAGRFLRQTMLGTEAVYEVIDVDGELVTAEVVRAPGLAVGTRVRLMAQAARAMECFDPPEPIAAFRVSAAGSTLRAHAAH